MPLKSILCAGTAAAILAGAPLAETPDGTYLDLGAGAGFLQDLDISSNGHAALEPGTGYFAALSGGYKIESGVRVELEAALRGSSFDAVTSGLTFGRGKIESTSLMLNGLYDIDLGPGTVLSLGAGLGASRIALNPKNDDDFALPGENATVFAYQGLAEVEYLAGREVGVFAGYSYFRTADIAIADDANYASHTLYGGVRFHFQPEAAAVTASPAPPPPPPPSAKTFIVFFGFDSSDLSPEAQAVIAEAARAFQTTGAVAVTVVGHADTVGSAGYNLPLSERRAASVKSGLVARGVPAEAVTASGHGFTDPLVETGADAKEPQNRRATIDLSGSGT